MGTGLVSVGQRLLLNLISISLLVFFAYQIPVLFFKFKLDATTTFKFAEISSLALMNLEGFREVDQVLIGQSKGLARFLFRFYRGIQFYIFFVMAVGVSSVFFAFRESWINVYVINILLLSPVLFYGVPNYYCVRHRETPDAIRQHMGWFLYFLNLPIGASILVFLLASISLLDTDDKAKYFVGGASALLLFLTHAVTVCIDQHANIALYQATPRGIDPDKRAWYYTAGVALVVLGGAIISLLFFADASSAARWSGRCGILAGLVLVTHALWAIGWRGFRLSTLTGCLYVLLAVSILYSPPTLAIAVVAMTALAIPAYCRFSLSSQLLSISFRLLLSLLTPILALLCFWALVTMGHIHLVQSDKHTQAIWAATVVLGMDILTQGLWWIWLTMDAKFARIGEAI